MTDVFISYKREERDKAHALAEFFVDHGYSVWWDAELLAGSEFAAEISEVINKAKIAIVLWSEEAKSSDFVLSEAAHAHSRGILIPATLDGSIPSGPLSKLHTLDLSSWDGTKNSDLLVPLLTAVATKAGQGEVAPEDVSARDVLHGPEIEVEYWKSIKQGSPGERAQLKAYLKKFAPDPIFKELAIARIEALSKKKFPPFMKVVGGAAAVIALIGAVAELGDRFDLWRGITIGKPEKQVLARYEPVEVAVTTSYWASFTQSAVWNCVDPIEVPKNYVLIGGELINEKQYPERVRAGCPGPEQCNGHNEYCKTHDRSAACVVNSDWYHWYTAKASKESLPTDFDTMCAEPETT